MGEEIILAFVLGVIVGVVGIIAIALHDDKKNR